MDCFEEKIAMRDITKKIPKIPKKAVNAGKKCTALTANQ